MSALKNFAYHLSFDEYLMPCDVCNLYITPYTLYNFISPFQVINIFP